MANFYTDLFKAMRWSGVKGVPKKGKKRRAAGYNSKKRKKRTLEKIFK